MWLSLLLWISAGWMKFEMQVKSQFQPQTSYPLLKSNLNPLWWKLCKLNWSASLWGNTAPQKHSDHGTKKIYYAHYLLSRWKHFWFIGASVNLIKPSNIVLWRQEQFQNHLLHESWIGLLPSQRWWCCQHETLFLACLEQPYFCQKHSFKKIYRGDLMTKKFRIQSFASWVWMFDAALWNITASSEQSQVFQNPRQGLEVTVNIPHTCFSDNCLA